MTRAEELFGRIGTGRHNALKRPKNSYDDRALRELINKANRSGTDCIINNGKGYYREGRHHGRGHHHRGYFN